jgi:hypothetical protein
MFESRQLLSLMPGIFPAGRDVLVGESNEPVVGAGEPMGIGIEKAQRMFRAAEWSFGADNPVMTDEGTAIQGSKPGYKEIDWREAAARPAQARTCTSREDSQTQFRFGTKQEGAAELRAR